MYETTELGFMTSVSADKGRVYFALYYEHPTLVADAAFKRAAATWRDAIGSIEGFRPGTDLFVEQGIRTEPQFRAAWNGIADQAALNQMPVWGGNIFSHASKDTRDDGLEFVSVQSDGTISQSDIKALNVMPWDQNGYLILSGCNTGLLGATRT